ncbi:MAG TPA: hypothetical protein VGR03_17060 [Candidatus Acidoferrum sp.]|nr:hypothetical protein [Candidatus Acidoferrum sp.]
MENESNAGLRHLLDLARNENNRQRPDLALGYLQEARSEIERREGEAIWAEHHLLLAEAYAAKCDPAAEPLFEELFDRLRKLPERHPELELLAHEHFADFLVRLDGRRSVARDHFEQARKLAIEENLREESARTELKLTKLHLEMDSDPELPNFKSFRRVAKNGGYTYQVQLASWQRHYLGQQGLNKGLRYARKRNVASDGYFADILESVKKSTE